LANKPRQSSVSEVTYFAAVTMLDYTVYTPTSNYVIGMGNNLHGNESLYTFLNMSRVSAVGIATGYWVGILVPAGLRRLFTSPRPGIRVHPASYPMGTEGSSPGGKAAGA
jgi:hypothetical protein